VYRGGRAATANDRLLGSKTVTDSLTAEVARVGSDGRADLLTALTKRCKVEHNPWQEDNSRICDLLQDVRIKIPKLSLEPFRRKEQVRARDVTFQKDQVVVTVEGASSADPEPIGDYRAEASSDGKLLYKKPTEFNEIRIEARELLVMAGATREQAEGLLKDSRISQSTHSPEVALADSWWLEKVWVFRIGYLAFSAALMLAIGWLIRKGRRYVETMDKLTPGFGIPRMVYLGAAAVAVWGAFGFVSLWIVAEEASQQVAGVAVVAVLATTVVFAKVQATRMHQAIRELR